MYIIFIINILGIFSCISVTMCFRNSHSACSVVHFVLLTWWWVSPGPECLSLQQLTPAARGPDAAFVPPRVLRACWGWSSWPGCATSWRWCVPPRGWSKTSWTSWPGSLGTPPTPPHRSVDFDAEEHIRSTKTGLHFVLRYSLQRGNLAAPFTESDVQIISIFIEEWNNFVATAILQA